LDKEKEREAKDKQNRDYIRIYFLLNDYRKVLEYAAQLKPADLADAWTAYRIGEAHSQTGLVAEAKQWYNRAITIWPYALDFQNKYAGCLLDLNNIPEAKKVYQFILEQNPKYAVAHTNLGFIYMQEGNNTMAYDHLNKALLYEPDSKMALINMAVWYHNNRLDDMARKTLLHLLKKYPENEQAKAMLADLAL
ncbi:MAG TPA: hypothetical protein VIN07_13735, partial [Flavipsychrobacter sp.]